jgi:hypothetical protein
LGLLFVLSGALAVSASATPVLLTVNPSLVTQSPFVDFFEFDFSFGDQLNGITLNGQSSSFDFLFDHNILARIAPHTDYSSAIGVLLSIETNAPGLPGFAGADTTGFLLGPDGMPLHPSLGTGQSASSDGSFDMGIYPTSDVPPIFEMSGVHFDVRFPNTGFVTTGGHIRLASNAAASVEFGTAAQLPEPATLLLTGIGLVTAETLRRSTRKKRHHSA